MIHLNANRGIDIITGLFTMLTMTPFVLALAIIRDRLIRRSQ